MSDVHVLLDPNIISKHLVKSLQQCLSWEC